MEQKDIIEKVVIDMKKSDEFFAKIKKITNLYIDKITKGEVEDKYVADIFNAIIGQTYGIILKQDIDPAKEKIAQMQREYELKFANLNQQHNVVREELAKEQAKKTK